LRYLGFANDKMIRLVVIETKKHSYRIFEGNKCVAEYVVENNILLDAEDVEKLRTASYSLA
jgi:hypothetical protein